ncbi:Cupin domain-containing protein [Succinivibrio dextrinosolvens]|jgi:mannose-6-phosphate isomerase-like protein (cupin superfamily)|uniref:cupin domain-containing protein n=1 Tax=Succinivibrio dextrinosolvens TaxID=83771 RepID=UPI0008EF5CE7|nr:cupin domain-containing protein [Succinivibrio dextrinosolvens]SFS72155.1 Cupin domain-containing protein [Succinivibrio dextrinosolvens]
MSLECILSENSKKPENQVNAENVSFADIGEFTGIKDYVMECPDAKLTMNAKLFLKDLLKFTGMEMSFGYMEPNSVGPFSHKHKLNEEVYLVLSGNGTMTVDGRDYSLKEGSVMRIDPQGVRKLSSGDKGLCYICIQTKRNSLEGYTMTDGEIL